MPKNARKGGLWAYLDAAGVLEKGTEEDIKAARKAYRKQYILNYRRKQRASSPEFTINFSKDNGGYSRVLSAAKTHGRAIPTFIRFATLAYISRTYIVPDRFQIARLELLLSQCLNEVQLIVRQKERYHWEREQKFEAIEKRIEKLESEINDILKQPSTIEELVIKELGKNPTFREQLLAILTSSRHDH